MLAPTFKLDHKYSAFGRVIEGMAAVDGIAIGEPPAQPTKIVRATIGGPLPAPPVVAAAPAPAAAPVAAAPRRACSGASRSPCHAGADDEPSRLTRPRKRRLRHSRIMRVDLFDFELPPDRIALRPARPRDSARLLLVEGSAVATAACSTCRSCCGPATCWCSTTPGSSRPSSKAGAARRASARRCTSAKARASWRAFVRNAKRVRDGDMIDFGKGVNASRGRARCGRRGPAPLPRRRAGRAAARAGRADAAAALHRRQARRPTTPTATIIRRCSPARRGGRGADRRAAFHRPADRRARRSAGSAARR